MTNLYLCRGGVEGVLQELACSGNLVESLRSLVLSALDGMLLPNAIVLATK